MWQKKSMPGQQKIGHKKRRQQNAKKARHKNDQK